MLLYGYFWLHMENKSIANKLVDIGNGYVGFAFHKKIHVKNIDSMHSIVTIKIMENEKNSNLEKIHYDLKKQNMIFIVRQFQIIKNNLKIV